MSQRISIIAGLGGPSLRPVRIVSIGATSQPAIPNGAMRNSDSPTGYTIGPGVPGRPWQVQVMSVNSHSDVTGFTFPLVKIVWYWPVPDPHHPEAFPDGEFTKIQDGISNSKRWVLLFAYHDPGSPYVAMYVTPTYYKSRVQSYSGSMAAAVTQIRSLGEFTATAAKETIKYAADVAEGIVGTAGSWGKWIALGGLTIVAAAVAGPPLVAYLKRPKSE